MSPDALALIRQRRAELETQGLGRTLLPLSGRETTVADQNGELLLMAGNDYLGLAGHPRLVAAAHRALDRHGTSASASRLISGTRDYHLDLEARIARFVGTEAALFFGSGFLANLGLIAALATDADRIVADALNHASLIDASRLSGAERRIYAHADPVQAAALLPAAPAAGLALLVTDGVFSMDGDPAPIPELHRLARERGALLVVDDSHAFGVWGPRGRGTLDHFAVGWDETVVVIGTFSKALGGYGGFIAAAHPVIDMLVQRARTFLFSTAPPPAQVAVAAEALALVDDEPWRRERLAELCTHARAGLVARGLPVANERGPILPIAIGDPVRTVAAAAALRERGIFVTAIRPPTVPAGTSRLRLTLSVHHDEAGIDRALDAVAAVMA